MYVDTASNPASAIAASPRASARAPAHTQTATGRRPGAFQTRHGQRRRTTEPSGPHSLAGGIVSAYSKRQQVALGLAENQPASARRRPARRRRSTARPTGPRGPAKYQRPVITTIAMIGDSLKPAASPAATPASRIRPRTNRTRGHRVEEDVDRLRVSTLHREHERVLKQQQRAEHDDLVALADGALARDVLGPRAKNADERPIKNIVQMRIVVSSVSGRTQRKQANRNGG